jgi:hypothetical protein
MFSTIVEYFSLNAFMSKIISAHYLKYLSAHYCQAHLIPVFLVECMPFKASRVSF